MHIVILCHLGLSYTVVFIPFPFFFIFASSFHLFGLFMMTENSFLMNLVFSISLGFLYIIYIFFYFISEK